MFVSYPSLVWPSVSKSLFFTQITASSDQKQKSPKSFYPYRNEQSSDHSCLSVVKHNAHLPAPLLPRVSSKHEPMWPFYLPLNQYKSMTSSSHGCRHTLPWAQKHWQAEHKWDKRLKQMWLSLKSLLPVTFSACKTCRIDGWGRFLKWQQSGGWISDSSKWGICCQLLAQGMLWVCACLTAGIRENQHELQRPSFRWPGMVFLSIYLLQNREESSMLESAAPETKETNLWPKHNGSLIFKVHNCGVWGNFSSEYNSMHWQFLIYRES